MQSSLNLLQKSQSTTLGLEFSTEQYYEHEFKIWSYISPHIDVLGCFGAKKLPRL